MEGSNRKKYLQIDSEMGSNEIFQMLDKIESETKNDI